MPENEFEKQVQQKMGGFKLRPGTEVWKTVSAAIVQQKNYRRQIILTVVFLCCFLAGSLFLSDTKTKHFSENKVAINSNIATAKNNTLLKVGDEVNNNKVVLQVKIISANATTRYLSSKKKLLQTIQEQGAGKLQTAKHRRTIYTTRKKMVNTSAGEMEEMITGTVVPDERIQQIPPEKHGIQKASKPLLQQNRDSITNKIIALKTTDTEKNNLDNVANNKKQTERKKKSKWIVGLTFTAGRSSTANKYLGSAVNSNNRYYDYSQSGNVANGNNSAGGGYIYIPSKIKSGLSFTTGVLASRKITLKSAIVIGLNYKLFSTSLAVGNDNSLNGIRRYGFGNTNSYRNFYHFIEIPVSIQTQIARIKEHPLYLDGGISFSQLINSNALQYNIAQSKYYIDNTLFHKTLIGLSVGLSFNLLNTDKAPLLLGPQFYYSTTPLAGSGMYVRSHYSFVGIRLQKMLKKN